MGRGFFFNISAHGHVNPTLPLVAELVRRGETITYHAGESERARIASTGARFRTFPSEMAPFRSPKSPEVDHLVFDCLLNGMPRWIEQALEEKPDYILFDFLAFWGRILAEQIGVPSIVVYPNPIPVIESMPPRIVFQMIDHLLPLGRKVRRMRQEIASRYHRPHQTFVEFLLDPGDDLRLVLTTREFQPSADRLTGPVHFVGPCHPDLPEKPEFPWEDLGGGPVVYATLGTVYGNNRSFFQTCIRAFSGFEGCVVLSTGNGLDPAELGPLPPRFIARRFVPQSELLERSHLFITHGGMNSIHSGLRHGVPMVVIPQGIASDQHGNARTVEALGVGSRLGRLGLRASVLRATAERLLSNTAIPSRLRRLREQYAGADSVRRGADLILECARKRVTRRLRNTPSTWRAA